MFFTFEKIFYKLDSYSQHRFFRRAGFVENLKEVNKLCILLINGINFFCHFSNGLITLDYEN